MRFRLALAVLISAAWLCSVNIFASAAAQEVSRSVAFNPVEKCKAEVARSQAEDAYCRKYEFIQDLKSDEKWYYWQKNALNYIWIGGSILSVVLTVLTAFLIAVGFADSGRNKILLASLPAAAALITTLMGQFQIRELWELREIGRIRMMELISNARLLTSDDDVKMREMIYLLEKERIHLARSQASQFFEKIRSTNQAGEERGREPKPKSD